VADLLAGYICRSLIRVLVQDVHLLVTGTSGVVVFEAAVESIGGGTCPSMP